MFFYRLGISQSEASILAGRIVKADDYAEYSAAVMMASVVIFHRAMD